MLLLLGHVQVIIILFIMENLVSNRPTIYPI